MTDRDLYDDFSELKGLCESACARLHAHKQHLESAAESYQPTTSAGLKGQTEHLLQEYTELLTDIDGRIGQKHALRSRLRVLQTMLGAVLSAGNWQSPSVRHTHHSQAGNETGVIRVYENDYKRDRHRDEKLYTKKFIGEYVDHPHQLAPACFVTSSGMAAVLTTLSYLHQRVPSDALVLAGNSTYFQSRWILEALFPKRVRYVDEHDIEALVEHVQTLKPAVIFFDTLSNNAFAMLDLARLLPRLQKILPHSATIVFDNTALSMMCQPLAHMSLNITGPRVVVVESLSKYHQFGLDRLNGGVIWFPHHTMLPSFGRARSNSGTIISDVSVLAQPEPNRELLSRRLARIGKNAQRLAEHIDSLVQTKRTPLARVVYPGLPTHPSYSWKHKREFNGGFFVCEFSPKLLGFIAHDHLLKKILAEAQKRDAALVCGAGFGFDTTRVYILPDMEGIQKSMLRVSVGTETAEEIETLCEVFTAVLI